VRRIERDEHADCCQTNNCRESERGRHNRSDDGSRCDNRSRFSRSRCNVPRRFQYRQCDRGIHDDREYEYIR